MKKRGQAGEVIRYIIIAAIVVVIIFFGFKSFTAIKERICKAEIAKFQIDLKNLDKEVKYGTVREFTKQVPCNVEEIYFFDLDKDINLDFLKDMPLVKDSIQSGVEKNVFLMKNNEIIDSFYAGNLDIEDPHFKCFLPRYSKINFFLEGKGTSVSISKGNLQPLCGE